MTKLYISERFGVIPHRVLYDSKLSLKAKGLFGYLQSKPNGWNFSAKRISYETVEGVDAVQSGLKELEEHGYLTRKKHQDEKGRWQWQHILSANSQDYPELENPVTDDPVQEKPVIKQKGNNKKDIVNNIYILSHWNSKEIIQHKESSTVFKAIELALKKHSKEEIIKGIDNYAEILHSEKTYWSHKWTLAEFLKRENGLSVFLYKTVNDYKSQNIDKRPEPYKNQTPSDYSKVKTIKV